MLIDRYIINNIDLQRLSTINYTVLLPLFSVNLEIYFLINFLACLRLKELFHHSRPLFADHFAMASAIIM